MSQPIDLTFPRLRSSGTLALLGIGVLALLMLIPISMISGLIRERQERRAQAVAEVSGKWGRAQTVTGPALVVPFTHRVATEDGEAEGEHKGSVKGRLVQETAVFLPAALKVRSKVESQARSRGIFSVPVYDADLALEATFEAPDFSSLGLDVTDIAWGRASIAMDLSDVRAIRQAPVLTANRLAGSFAPGPAVVPVPVRVRGEDTPDRTSSGLYAPLGLGPGAAPVHVTVGLRLGGSSELSFVPAGRETTVELQGSGGDPSFQGNWLPGQRTVEGRTFKAAWQVPFLGRGFPQAWVAGAGAGASARGGDAVASAIEASRFGVALSDGVDRYRMAERSVKYAFLFIVLTFAAVWLVEVLAGVRVHPIQYLLVGAALYGYLYVVLVNEDYALVMGAVGLFAMVALVMYVTRRVDWYAVGREEVGVGAVAPLP